MDFPVVGHIINPLLTKLVWSTLLVLYWTWRISSHLDLTLGLLYNYLPKGRWIQVYIWRYELTLRGDSCFSIYQISWIKMKKELFVNNRLHLVTVCLHGNWQCFGDHFLWFGWNSVRNFFPPTSKCWQAKFCLFLGIPWYSCIIYR